MTARTIADREAGLARLVPQHEAPRPAPRQMPAGHDQAQNRPSRDTEQDPRWSAGDRAHPGP